MARQTITVSQSWQQIATGAAEIHILKKGSGTILFNETGSDTDALPVSPEVGQFYDQRQDVAQFVKAAPGANGWELLIIGVI